MTLEQAIKIVESRPMNANMAWGVRKGKGSNDYVICPTGFIKRFPNEEEYVYLKKGENFK